MHFYLNSFILNRLLNIGLSCNAVRTCSSKQQFRSNILLPSSRRRQIYTFSAPWEPQISNTEESYFRRTGWCAQDVRLRMISERLLCALRHQNRFRKRGKRRPKIMKRHKTLGLYTHWIHMNFIHSKVRVNSCLSLCFVIDHGMFTDQEAVGLPVNLLRNIPIITAPELNR
jgi:hypothetical protein